MDDNTPVQKQTKKKSMAPYLLGILCLIPLVGALVGFGLLLYALIYYKDKWLAAIGIFGILFTIFVYGALFYAGSHAKIFKESNKQLSRMLMNNLIKDVEYYKLQHGQYPDSLRQLLKDDKSAPIQDVVNGVSFKKKISYYYYEKIGEKYTLFSAGEDGIPHTKDDLYPEVSISDSSKIGYIQ